MPTLLVLDTSLSMARLCKPVPMSVEQLTSLSTSSLPPGESLTDAALAGIHRLLDHLDLHFRLEPVAAVTFSKQSDLLAPFSRDTTELRAKLELWRTGELENSGQTTNVVEALGTAAQAVQEHFGNTTR